ncbi:hypothetical protein AURDEDRAFT_173088 [Auricularia subglabra TFB-10046 SS5]|nr:hypothetical protein AURDEDRAFT_173088 [Auricularia subglabra TFB-10046 SS5]
MFSPVLSLLAALATANAAAHTHWFTFGDSYTTTTFNQNSTQPNDGNPLGNPALPGLTACGRVPNYVYYASVKYNTTVTYAYNFAVGGATTDQNIVAPRDPKVPSVVQQIETFAASYAGPTPAHTIPWTGSNSLFSVWIGINDVGISYTAPASVNQSKLHDELIASYFNNLQTLYNLGARSFLLLTLCHRPILLAVKQEYQDKYRAAVLDFNAKLAAGITKFRTTNPTVAIRTVDTHALVTNILDSPQQYGFKDAVSYNATEPTINEVVWCNAYHISPKTHDYVAQAVRDALEGSELL